MDEAAISWNRRNTRGDQLTIRGNTAEEFYARFTELGLIFDADSFKDSAETVQQVAMNNITPLVQPQGQQAAPPNPSPVAAAPAPVEAAPTVATPAVDAQGGNPKTLCAHGQRSQVGPLQGKFGPYYAYFCALPKGTPGSCKPEFDKNPLIH